MPEATKSKRNWRLISEWTVLIVVIFFLMWITNFWVTSFLDINWSEFFTMKRMLIALGIILSVALIIWGVKKFGSKKSADDQANQKADTNSSLAPTKKDDPKKSGSSAWDYVGKGLLILIVGLIALSLIKTVGDWVLEHDKYTRTDPKVPVAERLSITETLHLTREWSGWIYPLSLVHEAGSYNVDWDMVGGCAIDLMQADGKIVTFTERVPRDPSLKLHSFQFRTNSCESADLVLKLTPI